MSAAESDGTAHDENELRTRVPARHGLEDAARLRHDVGEEVKQKHEREGAADGPPLVEEAASLMLVHDEIALLERSPKEAAPHVLRHDDNVFYFW